MRLAAPRDHPPAPTVASDGRSGDDDPHSLPFLRESRGGLTRFMGVRYHAWHTLEALLWAAVILLMLLAPLRSIPR